MELNLKITDYQTWGRYLNIYTVYRVDVKYKSDEWFVFRRFSEFTDMHTSFLRNESLRPLAEPLSELLPEKGFFGSTLATFDSICVDRKQSFSAYLEALLQEKMLRKCPVLLSFIDVQNKGISGVKRLLGHSQVIREEFTMCSLGRLAMFGYNSWVRSYICLTKKGWIYCSKCIYDTPDECDVKVDLKSSYTRIGGVASDGVLYVTNNSSVSLYIKFSNTHEFSSWLRQLSDFSINTAQCTASKAPVVKQEGQKRTPSSHFRAAGTGYTEDDLSGDYGI